MSVVLLVFELVAGDANLGSVDDDDVVATIEVRRKLHFVLAEQVGSGQGSQASEGLTFGVDDIPIVRQLAGFGGISLNHS